MNSGDSINLITDPKFRSEVNFIFSSVTAPKLARRPRSDAPSTPSAQPDDAPYAWEAREFLRQRIIGKIVWYTVEKDDGNRKYGTLYYPEKGNVVYSGERWWKQKIYYKMQLYDQVSDW